MAASGFSSFNAPKFAIVSYNRKWAVTFLLVVLQSASEELGSMELE
jgi:hypothetical protein